MTGLRLVVCINDLDLAARPPDDGAELLVQSNGADLDLADRMPANAGPLPLTRDERKRRSASTTIDLGIEPPGLKVDDVLDIDVHRMLGRDRYALLAPVLGLDGDG